MSTITKKDLERFSDYLQYEEKSKNTIEKYLRDAKAFVLFLANTYSVKICITKRPLRHSFSEKVRS